MKKHASVNKISNKLIVNILINAKERYEKLILKGLYSGMCSVLMDELIIQNYNIKEYDDIRKIIPKFNTKFLKADYPYCNYWWAKHDKYSRRDAFDKLITHYKKMEDKDFEKVSKNKYSL